MVDQRIDSNADITNSDSGVFCEALTIGGAVLGIAGAAIGAKKVSKGIISAIERHRGSEEQLLNTLGKEYPKTFVGAKAGGKKGHVNMRTPLNSDIDTSINPERL